MMARALDGLERGLYGGATDRIRTIDVKFKRPLILAHGIGDRALPRSRATPSVSIWRMRGASGRT